MNSMEQGPSQEANSQSVKKFPAFYGTRRFITVFARARHWARCIQSTPSHPVSPRSILILSFHISLGLPSGLFPSGFPTKVMQNRWHFDCINTLNNQSRKTHNRWFPGLGVGRRINIPFIAKYSVLRNFCKFFNLGYYITNFVICAGHLVVYF